MASAERHARHTSWYKYLYTCIWTYIYINIYTYAYIYIYIYMYIYIYTCRYTHTITHYNQRQTLQHTPAREPLWRHRLGQFPQSRSAYIKTTSCIISNELCLLVYKYIYINSCVLLYHIMVFYIWLSLCFIHARRREAQQGHALGMGWLQLVGSLKL